MGYGRFKQKNSDPSLLSYAMSGCPLNHFIFPIGASTGARSFPAT
jgi:hypothetical protein